MVDKFKPAGRDQWYKLALQLCARGRELNLGWKLRDGQTCRNRFDKLIPNKKPTGSTEVPDVVLEAMWLKDAIDLDNSPGSSVTEEVNENLQEKFSGAWCFFGSETFSRLETESQ